VFYDKKNHPVYVSYVSVLYPYQIVHLLLKPMNFCIYNINLIGTYRCLWSTQ